MCNYEYITTHPEFRVQVVVGFLALLGKGKEPDFISNFGTTKKNICNLKACVIFFGHWSQRASPWWFFGRNRISNFHISCLLEGEETNPTIKDAQLVPLVFWFPNALIVDDTTIHASTKVYNERNFHHLNRTLTRQFGLSGGQSKSSWWFQPMWKKWSSNWKSSPNWGENKKCLKPPPRSLVISQENIEWSKMLFQLWLQLLWSMACHPPDTIIIVKSQT